MLLFFVVLALSSIQVGFAKDTLTFGYDAEWEPIDFSNEYGDIDGLCSDYWKLIESEVSFKAKFSAESTWNNQV